MATQLEDPRLAIGGNEPPMPTPYEAFRDHIADLMDEARGFLDGDPIANEGQAAAVSKLLTDARDASRDADKQRKVEKEPHLEAGRTVDATWKPIIERADLTVSTCKQALAPWLRKLEDEQRAAADLARKEAEAKAEEARAAIASANLADLEAREQAEILIKEASKADKLASKAENARAQAKGGARAVSLRSVWYTAMTDPVVALKHYRAMQPDLLKAWLIEQAEKDVHGGARSIPGFEITEERIAQ
jgi:hypothetical protein